MAVKAGAVSNDQLDAMGYRKTPKLPALPAPDDDEPAKPASAPKAAPRGEVFPPPAPLPSRRWPAPVSRAEAAMSSPIEQLVMASQEQHRRYYELYGQQPVTGDGLRQVAPTPALWASRLMTPAAG